MLAFQIFWRKTVVWLYHWISNNTWSGKYILKVSIITVVNINVLLSSVLPPPTTLLCLCRPFKPLSHYKATSLRTQLSSHFLSLSHSLNKQLPFLSPASWTIYMAIVYLESSQAYASILGIIPASVTNHLSKHKIMRILKQVTAFRKRIYHSINAQ